MSDDSEKTSAFLASLGVDDDPIVSTGTSLEVIDIEPQEIVAEEVSDIDQSVNADFTVARANILEVVDIAKKAMAELAEIAKQSQHPRAFEVLFNGVKTVLEAQQDMLDLHKKREGLKPGSVAREDIATGPTKNTTNNLFVGSTADLQRILSEMNKS